MTRAEQIRNTINQMSGNFTGDDICKKLFFTEVSEKRSVIDELRKMCFQHDLLDLVQGDKIYSLKTVYKHKKEVVKKETTEPKREVASDVISKLSNREITRFIAEGMTEVFNENDELKTEIETLRETVKEADGLRRDLSLKIKQLNELQNKFDELLQERNDHIQRDAEHCRTIRGLKDKLLKADEEINGLRRQVSDLARFNKNK